MNQPGAALRWVRYGELAALGALAPLFVFPDPALTPWLMAIPVALRLVRWGVTGQVSRVTPLNPPLLGLAGMLSLSLLVTYDAALSFPKVAGVFYGIVLAETLATHLRSRRAIRAMTAGICMVSVAIALVALLGTKWVGSTKIPLVSPLMTPIYEALPRAVEGMPRAETGFSPNQVGGTLAFAVPLWATLWLHATSAWRWQVGRIAVAVATTAGFALTGFVLMLTQSRTAIGAVTLVLWLLVLGFWRRYALAPKAVLVVLMVLATGLEVLLLTTLGGGEVFDSSLSLAGRVEIWNRSWHVLWDHAVTGIGFDTLPSVVHARYTTFFIAPDNDFTHAHNLFLQTALDLGIPGLVAFVGLLLTASGLLLGAAQRSRGTAEGAIALGLLLGLAAHVAFGLTDAIALGQKPGLLLWVYLGLGGAVSCQPSAFREETE